MIVKILGNGTVYMNNKRWYCEIPYLDELGKKHKKYIPGVSERDARKNGDKFIDEFNASESVYSSKTLAEVLEELINQKKRSDNKKGSIIVEERNFNNYIKELLGNKKMYELNILNIQQALNVVAEQGYSDSILKKLYSILKQCWEFYMNKTGVSYNPMNSVVKPVRSGKEKPTRYFTVSEMEKIYFAAKQGAVNYEKCWGNYCYAVVLIEYTGIRVGELLALQWENVDFNNKTMLINKTVSYANYDSDGRVDYRPRIQNSTKSKNSNRTIYLHPRALEALHKLHDLFGQSKYVVPSVNGTLMYESKINKLFLKILKDTDIDFKGRTGVHTLRHSFGTEMRNNDFETETISVYLGHGDERITKAIYLHDNEKRAEKAIEDSGLFMS